MENIPQKHRLGKDGKNLEYLRRHNINLIKKSALTVEARKTVKITASEEKGARPVLLKWTIIFPETNLQAPSRVGRTRKSPIGKTPVLSYR